MKKNLFNNLYFFRQFLRSPFITGSICPSSRYLSRALVASALNTQKNSGLIIDLGAGSGVVSRELLNWGVSSDRILALDISEYFKNIFKKNCPNIRIHIGDARNLANILMKYSPHLPIQAIISSLPLKCMPIKLVTEIMLEIWKVLQMKGGVLVQYTYAVWMRSSLELFGFGVTERHLVPFNFPPALVEKYYPKNNRKFY